MGEVEGVGGRRVPPSPSALGRLGYRHSLVSLGSLGCERWRGGTGCFSFHEISLITLAMNLEAIAATKSGQVGADVEKEQSRVVHELVERHPVSRRDEEPLHKQLSDAGWHGNLLKRPQVDTYLPTFAQRSPLDHRPNKALRGGA